jgi:hypothetical protein
LIVKCCFSLTRNNCIDTASGVPQVAEWMPFFVPKFTKVNCDDVYII